MATSFYNFDARNQLAEAEVPEGTVEMTWNGDGQRATRTGTTSEETRYLYDFKKLTTTVYAAAAQVRRFATEQVMRPFLT